MANAVMWFRRDLRLSDNPALADAVASARAGDGSVVPLFVVDDALWGPAGDNRRAFLAACLAELDDAVGGALVVRRGDPVDVVARAAADADAAEVFAAEDFGPYGRARDERVAKSLASDGVALQLSGSPYAVAPGAVVTKSGDPYKVFTPFSRAWRQHSWEPPITTPRSIPWASGVAGRELPPSPATSATLPAGGEAAAKRAARRFCGSDLDRYDDERDAPASDSTSRLSPYLKWGCIHPRQLLAKLGRSSAHDTFRTELCWREFYADVLFHRPDTARRAFLDRMRVMEVDSGRRADERFEAWAAGETGFPIVDAGMRQLLAEGWMHNRVRMITASFLVKDLHVDWTRGARHFMAHLVDGDLASNQHGWQWVAGTGTDAAPYFRIFNPVVQSKRVDPDGDYIRRYVTELAGVPAPAIHEPWTAMRSLFDGDGRREGPRSYPVPIVDHAAEREEALRRYAALR